ncbi:D-glycero-beta-D-manno-heptose 1,7-bisphosphate 7-phosphatase [Lentisphaerota bacterium ZTH]|nr:D-glycero-beta-D-manno-heptose 1,7-bisphosphate 7-phosphatase [Lentisphaerota bacterium]WET05768.1 D-glycero-beta-D-manno-heptose 1,7-bisphosphate 7-phosphatase [Lentisphaerota bacterium ZTH]
MSGKKACFLDRDGVINEEVNYLFEPEKVAIIPGVTEALKMLKRHGYLTVVVTNQAGVARGYYEEKDIHAVHARIEELLDEHEAGIDAFYYCPHHPEFSDECECRKPNAGMLLKAAEQFDIDMSESFLVGDRISDIYAARNAGCAEAYLVRTGHGANEIENKDVSDIEIADNLLHAVQTFIK